MQLHSQTRAAAAGFGVRPQASERFGVIAGKGAENRATSLAISYFPSHAGVCECKLTDHGFVGQRFFAGSGSDDNLVEATGDMMHANLAQ